MTCKSALAGLPFGGGKSVIMAAPAPCQDLLRAHAAAINALHGAYIGAGDVGVSLADVEFLRKHSPHIVAEVSNELDSGFFTAVGLVAAMRGAARMLWQTEELRGRNIVIQGCGKVGASLAALLRPSGAYIAVSDLDEARADQVARATSATVLPPDQVLSESCDILSPCAVGPVFNRQNAALLSTRAIVGGANCQLEDDDIANVLAARGVLYVPDFVANAGGVISGMATLADWTLLQVEQRIAETGERVCSLVEQAERNGQSVLQAAVERVDSLLTAQPLAR
jgi:leucine dehydrogenase